MKPAYPLALALACFGVSRPGLPAQLPAAGLAAATQAPEPMPALANPGHLQTVTDPTFGTTIRRITDAAPQRQIVPMYNTVQAWNADESLMILYERGRGHRLHDGRTYAFLRMLPIRPLDIEQVFWDRDDPHYLYYPTYVRGANTTVYRRRDVRDGSEVDLFDFGALDPACAGGGTSMGNDVQMPSYDDDVVGFRCQSEATYLYRISTGELTEVDVLDDELAFIAAMPAPSGQIGFHLNESYDGGTGQLLRRLDMRVNKSEHACLGRWADGSDALFTVAFDAPPSGERPGQLLVHDLATGLARDLLPQDDGWPYPRSETHHSALAHKAEPGWVAMSMIGDPSGAGLLDQELLLVRATKTGPAEVYRIGHHRSDERPVGYWGEPHPVLSPTGTRVLFGSDWGATGTDSTINSYVVELPSYGSVPVPATLVRLTAKPTPDGRLDIRWTTATETGVERFAVRLRGETEEAWREVASAAADGPGDYAVTSAPLPAGTYYLRLRTVDEDGSHAESAPVAVRVARPALRIVSLEGAGFRVEGLGARGRRAGPLQVFDSVGRLVYRHPSAEASVDATAWPSGAYTVVVGTWRGQWIR